MHHRQAEVLTTFADRRIEQIALTHFHEDHAGNAYALSQHHHCPVRAGALTAQRVATAYPLLPYEHFWFGKIDPCPGVIPVADRLETDHYSLQPISTLGHSDDHHVLLEASEGWLFAGDFYIGNLKVFRRGENIYQQIEAARHVLTLDFEVLFCGHNPALKQGKQAVARKLDYLETIVEQTKSAASRGLSETQIVRAVGLPESTFYRTFTSNDVAAAYLIRSVLQDSA